MRRCKVCGRWMRLKKENRYLVTKRPTGLNILCEAPTVYECFDCPTCGCQNIVNVREDDGTIRDDTAAEQEGEE